MEQEKQGTLQQSTVLFSLRNDGDEGETEYWQNENCSQSVRNEVNNYLNVIVNTQQHLSSLFRELEKETEPVVVILYGDHKPRFSDSFYEETGMEMGCNTLEGFLNYYATNYLIWANDAAKHVFQEDFIGEGPTISPCYLMAYLFDLLGWEENSIIQLNRQLMEQIPVINTNGYYLINGIICTELSDYDQKLLKRMDIVQYYFRHGYLRSS